MMSVSETGPEPETQTAPTITEAGIVIENERRRMVVFAIAEADADQMGVGGLAEAIASAENEMVPAALSGAERKSVYNSLNRVHLPKLDKMGIVDYDDDRKTIEKGPAADAMLQILNIVADVCAGEDRGEN